ncbi:hypothetical protein [Maridesulfovibrio frigidus]|uniref:hypothetical protein n=1 Tax=Maridesulfovibrio frigidus TaxID=340956 RepID=UPI0004E14559|nr:hypothetical protein [Maridesulfovibrio frigidus]
MKISKYGNSSYGSSNSGSSRIDIFRKKYKVGEVLHGRLLKWENQKLGWVEVNDQTLLANISSSPNPGDSLIFLVEQLYPDIILKEISADELSQGGCFINPTDITREFVAKRAAFEAQSRSILNKSYTQHAVSNTDKLTYFLQVLEDDTKSLILYFETLECVSKLNSALKRSSLHYLPWLMPLALNQEIVLKVKKDSQNQDNSFFELFYAFDHPSSAAQPMRFKIMYKKPQCGFKLLTDSLNLSRLLAPKFKDNFPEYLGIERIPSHYAGGFLSELLGSQ